MPHGSKDPIWWATGREGVRRGRLESCAMSNRPQFPLIRSERRPDRDPLPRERTRGAPSTAASSTMRSPFGAASTRSNTSVSATRARARTGTKLNGPSCVAARMPVRSGASPKRDPQAEVCGSTFVSDTGPGFTAPVSAS
jgi:hypothetical protein